MNLTRLRSRETEPLYRIVEGARGDALARGLEYDEAVIFLNRRLEEHPDERNRIVPEKLVSESWWMLSSKAGQEKLFTFADDFEVEAWVEYLNARQRPGSGRRWHVEEVALRDAFALGLHTPADGFDLDDALDDNEEDMLEVYDKVLEAVEVLTRPSLFKVSREDIESSVETALRVGESFLEANIVQDDMTAIVVQILERAGWVLDDDRLVPTLAAAA